MKECSELASIRTYKPFEIVYVADRGQTSPAHIILSGRCSIIQYLNMNVSLLCPSVVVAAVIIIIFIKLVSFECQHCSLSHNNCAFRHFLPLTQIQYENAHERALHLQLPKKMESNCDIIQQMCTAASQSAHNQMEITAKDETMSGFMDIAAASKVTDAAFTSGNTSNNLNANETVTMDRRSHFVEIGEFSCGSIFSLGEHMDDRAIVAKHTQVQCLLIPRYWLFAKKQNAGNIWQRYTSRVLSVFWHL